MNDLNVNTLADLLYSTEQRIRYGHVPVSWEDRQHGALKQMIRKQAEQILFTHDVKPKERP